MIAPAEFRRRLAEVKHNCKVGAELSSAMIEAQEAGRDKDVAVLADLLAEVLERAAAQFNDCMLEALAPGT